MTYKKLLLAAALAAPVAIAAVSAQAQVAGVAVADPSAAILTASALGTATQQIGTTYKAQIDQARTRQQALQTQIDGMIKPLDTNKDGQVSDAELQAAQAAKNPILAQVQAAQQNGEAEINRINRPVQLAQAYAIEQIEQKYEAALNAVVASKKLSLVVNAGTALYSTPAVDVTDDIKAELDRSIPTVSITPPANWQPQQQTVQLLQQYQQAMYAQAMRQQQQGAPAPAGTTPPASGKKQQGR
jgi:Skp family chaperone for outer membrane proteins